jgi:murein DD-endopeptidase MepM/ murein hydrolase activator NlpD
MATNEELMADIKALFDDNIRNDRAGGGDFGVSRAGGRRSHNGTDFENPKGALVDAPVDGVVTKIGYPYADDLSYTYVEVTDDQERKHRLFYVSPEDGIEKGSRVTKGMSIGKTQDVSDRYPNSGMKPHVHYELKNTDGSFTDVHKEMRANALQETVGTNVPAPENERDV